VQIFKQVKGIALFDQPQLGIDHEKLTYLGSSF
jgi:hypothetical protein